MARVHVERDAEGGSLPHPAVVGAGEGSGRFECSAGGRAGGFARAARPALMRHSIALPRLSKRPACLNSEIFS